MAKKKNNDEAARVAISQDNAVLLLAAAEELGLDASVVAVQNGEFVVPGNVAAKAGVEVVDDEQEEAPEPVAAEPSGEGE